jgi:hypothetical protein
MDLSKKLPRRDLLKKSALGLAAVGAATAVPALVFAVDSNSPAQTGSAGETAAFEGAGPLVAYVHDAAKGEVVIMTGVNEVIVNDPQLVARLMGTIGV